MTIRELLRTLSLKGWLTLATSFGLCLALTWALFIAS